MWLLWTKFVGLEKGAMWIRALARPTGGGGAGGATGGAGGNGGVVDGGVGGTGGSAIVDARSQLTGDASGAGGGANGPAGVRVKFPDTAYWNPNVLTDAHGNAVVTLTLPDNLTTWHLSADASTTERTLLGAGVPLINALNVARRSIGNQILVDAVSNSIERVKEGKALGPSLGDCRTLFSGSVLEMIAVAEESGKLDQELVRIANVTEGDLDRQLKTAVAMAEPLMLFFIAGFIGTIFIGMVLPIFTLQQYVK